MDSSRPRRQGPRQSRLIGFGLHLAAIAGLIALASALYFASGPSTATGWWSSLETIALVAALAGTLALLLWLMHRGDRHLAPDGPQLLKNDKRAPVLYLRPFSTEAVLTAGEQLLARIMNGEVGPLIAVGDPGDRLPQLGAARFYERDFSGNGQGWQVFVRGMLLRSRLVLLVPGSSVGLAFEVAQCREVLAPAQLIVLVQGDRTTYAAFRAHARQAGLVLPEISSHDVGWAATSELIGLITFNRDWEARYWPLPSRALFADPTVGEREQLLRQALATPLASLGIVIRQTESR